MIVQSYISSRKLSLMSCYVNNLETSLEWFDSSTKQKQSLFWLVSPYSDSRNSCKVNLENNLLIIVKKMFCTQYILKL